MLIKIFDKTLDFMKDMMIGLLFFLMLIGIVVITKNFLMSFLEFITHYVLLIFLVFMIWYVGFIFRKGINQKKGR